MKSVIQEIPNSDTINAYLIMGSSRFKNCKNFLWRTITKFKEEIANTSNGTNDTEINQCKNRLTEEWKNEFQILSIEKGKLYYTFNKFPRNKQWH